MPKLSFNIPFKLERKVLMEKSGLNRHVRIENLASKKIMNLKKKASILISVAVGIFFSYFSIFLTCFKPNLIEWNISSRIAFLVLSIALPFVVQYYCSHQWFKNDEDNKENEYKIDYISANWFKKVLSIFIAYLVLLVLFCIVISFCTMSTDISKMSSDSLEFTVSFLDMATIIICALIHHNILKFFNKEV